MLCYLSWSLLQALLFFSSYLLLSCFEPACSSYSAGRFSELVLCWFPFQLLLGFEQPKWLKDRFKADATKLLRWTETDSILVAFKRRMMVHAKLRELFVHKVLLERRKNFVPRHPLASMDLQVLDVLAEAHKIAELDYLGLRKQHKLTIPDAVFRAFQHGQRDDQFCELFEEGTHEESFHSLSACEPVEMVYEEIHPAQTDRIFSDSHSVSSLAQTAAQLRDLVSNISLELLHSQELRTSFKIDFNERMKSLELSAEDLRTSHVELVNKHWRQHLDLLRRGHKLKDDLSSEITSARLMLHEEAQKQSTDVNLSLASLSSQLAEVVAHLKKADDVKKGEGGSSSCRKGESSSGDRHRDSGGKRRSELPDAISGPNGIIPEISGMNNGKLFTDGKTYCASVSVVEVLGVIAACGLLDRVRAGAAVIKSSSGILPVQGRRGDVGV
ncbi:acetyl-CoA carboxylase [Dorcoceras hygrometricum]|uniref:Acetyl-CoA carboxylase n=1 Tax=Dorcoceras hygrometricum TaxID=472368 RepID=A0A2Z7DD22_9LAMI|nr:acetyl-CoA carboxylase [Dorcoceras hygrometricum]